MMESSLSFTDGDRCSSVSRCNDDLAVLPYLMKFQECTERRLDKRVGFHRNKLKRTEELLQ